jgi:hypothetical protein
LLDPVRDCLTPEVAARIVALRAEYESLVQAGNLIAVLQAKARAALAKG